MLTAQNIKGKKKKKKKKKKEKRKKKRKKKKKESAAPDIIPNGSPTLVLIGRVDGIPRFLQSMAADVEIMRMVTPEVYVGLL